MVTSPLIVPDKESRAMRASATFRTFSVIAVIGVALLGAGCAKKNACMD